MKKITWKTFSRVLFTGTCGAIIIACAAPSGAQTSPPVYVCKDFTSCAHGQYLEVFDRNGAPIFSVGQTGGADVFGDDFRLFGHDDPFNPEIVITDKPVPTSCTAPERWINVTGSWTCHAGRWVRQ